VWVQHDIKNIISKVRAKMPGITPVPTRSILKAQTQPIQTIERPKRGRRITLTPAALLTFYENEAATSDMVMLTITEVAERLKVSRATVERCERVLRAEGFIERRLFNRRQSSCCVRPSVR